MLILEKKGYLLSIQDWVGNLGNHIIQLAGALNVAEKTQSKLTIPQHPLLKKRVFDFRDASNDNCHESVGGRFFYKYDCFQYPITFDRDRRKIFQDNVYETLNKKGLGERLRELTNAKRSERVYPGTLVINLRSGRDIFSSEPPPQNDYMQPPLSFYKHVIESHGYEDCLIVTEADRRNPCIEGLMSWKPGIRIKKHTSVADDVRTILGATDLIICHSTFSWCLALMSRNLQTLYQPATFQIRGVDGEWSSS